ncbi:WD40 repeat-like protein [Phellopilus nigrolimitatus]|nr:WD40 repeat-like protein [Phellopilus nigrolimitatus]
MRTQHTQYPLPAFPVYSAAFVGNDKLILGGGGGSSRSGIKNKLRLYEIPSVDKFELISELELDKDEDTPMSMVADGSRIVCGINSSTEQLDKGINQNCRVYKIEKDTFNLTDVASTLRVTRANMEECQKVTAISPGRTLVAAAGTRDLTILSYPTLVPAATPLRAEHDIYDVSFSPTTVVVATTDELLIYVVPTAIAHKSSPAVQQTRSKKQKQKAKAEHLEDLKLIKSVEPPALPGSNGGTSSFRAVRFHPSNSSIAYSVLNTTFPRTRGSKMAPKQGYVCRWDADTWEVSKVRKVGEKGITCFDVSPNGKYVAYGSADHSVGILDANTLAPLLSVLKAHDFPATVLRFNPASNLLVSGSADNTIRAVAVPESLTGTTWTTGSVVLVTLLILLLSILISYAFISA